MTFKEFKKAVEDWGKIHGYKPVIEADTDYIEIVFVGNGYPDTICEIHKSERSVIDLHWESYIRNLPENTRNELFKIVTEFAATPIEKREDKEREDNKTFDSIINRLEVIQANAEDVMNWTIQEIQERSRDLRNNLDDIIIDLEECKKRKGDL